MLSEADPLYAPCAAGAAGDDAKAVECFALWDRRVPQLLGKAEEIRRSIWRTFPNVGADGKPFSGSYWNEAGKYEDLMITLRIFCRVLCWHPISADLALRVRGSDCFCFG